LANLKSWYIASLCFVLISSLGLYTDIGGVTKESIFVELLRVEVDPEFFIFLFFFSKAQHPERTDL